MHLSIGSLNPLTTIFTYENSYIFLLFKKNTSVFSQLETNFSKSTLLIDWKPFRIIFDSIYFNKIVFRGRSEDDISVIFKMLVSQQKNGFSNIEIEKQSID